MSGKDTRTFIAHEGDVWRNSHAPHFHWHSLLPQTCTKLLTHFRTEQVNTADWFHKKAAQLATELAAAMDEAATQRQQRTAA